MPERYSVTARHISLILIIIMQIVQVLSDYWSSCAILRSQLKLVAIKYPLNIEILPETPGFKATASVVFPSHKAKALISFILDMEIFPSWPMSVASMKCEVEVEYGDIE